MLEHLDLSTQRTNEYIEVNAPLPDYFFEFIREIIYNLIQKIRIIRINTVFKDYSSIKKAIILSRIYHDWMSLDMTAKEQGRLHKSVYLPFLIIRMNLYFYIFSQAHYW